MPCCTYVLVGPKGQHCPGSSTSCSSVTAGAMASAGASWWYQVQLQLRIRRCSCCMRACRPGQPVAGSKNVLVNSLGAITWCVCALNHAPAAAASTNTSAASSSVNTGVTLVPVLALAQTPAAYACRSGVAAATAYAYGQPCRAH